MRTIDIIMAKRFGKGKKGMAIGWPWMMGTAGGGGGTETTVTGVSPLLLAAALKKPIKSLTQYGLCTQDGTPTPAASVPIVCNNGTLAFIDDDLPSGYTRLQYIESDGTDGYVDTGIVINSVDTDVEVDYQYLNTSASQPKMLWGYMDGTSNLPRWGFGIYSSGWLGSPNVTVPKGSINSDRHTAIMSVYERGGASYYSGTLDGVELYGETALGNVSLFEENVLPLILFGRNNKGTAGNFANAKIFRFKVNKAGTLTHDLVPCMNDLGDIGFYDFKTDTFKAASGTLTAGAVDYSHAHLGAVGTPEVLMLNGANLADMSESNLDIGYYINNVGARTSGASNFYTLGLIAVKPNISYTIHTSASINYFNVMEYDSSKGFIKRTLWGSSGTPAGDTTTFTTEATTAFIRFGSNMDGTTVTYAKISAITWMLTEGGTAESYEPYREQTASAVNLFAVGDYADTQEIISGAVTRKVGIKVLDGTESIGTSNACFTIGINDRMTTKAALLCSHFPYSSKTSSQTDDETIISFASSNIGFRYDACADKAAFAAWLKAQYAAGTPVIVIYPLATETTEQYTAQPLSTVAGDNTVSWTAAVSGKTMSAVYIKGAASNLVGSAIVGTAKAG